MINYYCPDWYYNQPYYDLLFSLKKLGGQCFYPNVRIDTLFGCFPNCIWNGGGYSFDSGITLNIIYDYFNYYADKNITLQLTFTNPILEETDVYDRYGNTILQAASEYDYIHILVVSEILEKYIREKYPTLKIDKSIIATTEKLETGQDNLSYYLDCLKKYNKCVLPRKYGKDIDFLKQIPLEDRSRFEILVNDPCPLYCPYIYNHYEEMGKIQLYLSGDLAACKCKMISDENPYKQWTHRKDQLKYDEICTTLEPLGFTNIKLGGRNSYITGVLQTVPYLIKPEYQTDIYKNAFHDLLNATVKPSFYN